MKLLKIKVLIIGIGVMLIASSMFGQEEDHTRRRDRAAQMKMDHVSKKMTEDLNLSDEQEAEIKEILKAFRKERRTIQTVEKSKVDAEIREVLNSEQQATFEKMKVEREERLTKRKEGQTAIKEFREQNIAPFILQKRTELEALLSNEEKAGLEKIRSSKPETNMKGNRIRKGKNGKRQRISKEDRTLLKEISEKYATDIDRLQEEIEEKQAVWNKEIQSIKDAYRSKEEGKQKENDKRNTKREERTERKRGSREKGKDIRFLLMDVKN